MAKNKENNELMEKIVSLCKRRGFVYPSSEIYGGFSAIYDFGPYGTELGNNIKKEWWKAMVQMRDDIVGLDSAIFMSPKIWEASGHVGGFSDPLAECKKCHSRVRVDHLLEEIGVDADEKMGLEELNNIFEENKGKIKCPACGKSDFTEIKKFNLLVKSNLGNFTDDWSKEPVYLRGETCQGIYVNYKNVLDSTRVKIPFGIAQIGKAFRNEIIARGRDLTPAKRFSLMVKSNIGAPTDDLSEENVVYLRPETCGGIYLDYKNIVGKIAAIHGSNNYGIEFDFTNDYFNNLNNKLKLSLIPLNLIILRTCFDKSLISTNQQLSFHQKILHLKPNFYYKTKTRSHGSNNR
jgi:glycyl-tRNA synthetase (class II)